jgi:hypothetical protein
MSCLLHPALKQFQIAPHEKAKAVSLVKAELLKRQSSTSSGSSSSTINITSGSSSKSSTTSKSQQLTPTISNILSECFDVPVEDEDPLSIRSPHKELEQYLSSSTAFEPDDDVLLYWKKHQCTFPSLASIVKTIYNIPASNTTVERLFSTAGNTVSDRRTNLDVEKVSKLLFLNKNLLTLKELDYQQLLHIREKRKLDQMVLPLSPSSPNNIETNNDDEEELFLSSSTTKRARTFDDDYYSEEEIVDEQ